MQPNPSRASSQYKQSTNILANPLKKEATKAQKLEIIQLAEELQRRKDQRILYSYRPYAKQNEFHAAGATFRERLLMASNQSGKTLGAAFEIAMHLTGKYPDWWQGRRYAKANHWLAGSESGELTRRGVQRLLLGRDYKTAPGTGSIPGEMIELITPARGVPELVDTVRVRHVSGGVSTISLKSYDQGRGKWQADTVDGVWFDEEPPEDVYFEGLTRTNTTMGPVMLTFTPLKGMSKVVSRFLIDKPAGSTVITMTIDDAEHYTPEQRAQIIASYPPHEREARARGVPSMGSGLIFPVSEELIGVAAFPLPAHWVRLVGCDFGWDHPAAFVWMAWDRDTDTVYIYDVLRMRETLIPVQAMAITGKGKWIPVAWPHDGYQVRDAMHGDQLAQQYRAQGVNMRPEHAHFEDSASVGETKVSRISTEAGIQAMLTRFQSGKLKVFSHLNDWFEEFRMYHRKDGLIVKERDDLLSATRIGIMDLRHAITEPKADKGVDYGARADWF